MTLVVAPLAVAALGLNLLDVLPETLVDARALQGLLAFAEGEGDGSESARGIWGLVRGLFVRRGRK